VKFGQVNEPTHFGLKLPLNTEDVFALLFYGNLIND
jgi:hypothetical protein